MLLEAAVNDLCLPSHCLKAKPCSAFFKGQRAGATAMAPWPSPFQRQQTDNKAVLPTALFVCTAIMFHLFLQPRCPFPGTRCPRGPLFQLQQADVHLDQDSRTCAYSVYRRVVCSTLGRWPFYPLHGLWAAEMFGVRAHKLFGSRPSRPSSVLAVDICKPLTSTVRLEELFVYVTWCHLPHLEMTSFN